MPGLARPLLCFRGMTLPMPRKPRVPPRLAGRSRPRMTLDPVAGDPPVGFALGREERDRARAILEAHLAYAQRRRERQEAVIALGLSSVLPWVGMVWPGLLPPAVRTLAFVAWCGLLLVAAAAFGSELRWRHRMVGQAVAPGDDGARS